jgi:twitching motility protein PilT
MLAESIQGIVAQALIPKHDGTGRVAAHEILVATQGIRAMIREGKTHQIPSAIQTGRGMGMKSMDQAVTKLCTLGVISREEAARIVPSQRSSRDSETTVRRPLEATGRRRG